MIKGMSNPLRLAVVGVGRMGSFHARVAARSEVIEVAAVVDNHGATAESVGGELDAAAYTDLDSLTERDDVEAWLLATPTTSHPDHVRKAIEAGVHILCEKPLALDPGESEALGRVADEAGLVLQVGFWRRFAPPWVAAKAALDDGAIGRPLMLRLSQWDADPPPAAFCDPEVSGGLAIDCGVHEFDLASWLTGLAVERVTARNLPLVDESLAEVGDVDNLVAVLDLTGGVVATVDLSRNCRYGDDVRTEILGSEGALFVELLPRGRTRLATSAGTAVVPGSEVEDAFGEGIRLQAEAFAGAVRGLAGDTPGAEASTNAVAVGLAVREAGSGKQVEL
jgi:predicted dehydrogenase